MILIEVKPDALRQITAKTGKSYRVLTAYAQVLKPDGTPQPYPVEFETFLGANEQPPAPGVYTLAPASIYVKDGRLSLAPKLIPAKR